MANGRGPDLGRILRKDVTRGDGFINPYNFVELPEQAPERLEPPGHEKFTGYSGAVTCELTNVTALCVADGEKSVVKEGVAPEKPFFRIDDEIALPASSLKGMLRAVMETITNSCMTILTDQMAVFRDNRRRIPRSRGVGIMTRELSGRRVLGRPAQRSAQDIKFPRHGLLNQDKVWDFQSGQMHRGGAYTGYGGNELGKGQPIPMETLRNHKKMVEDRQFTWFDNENKKALQPREVNPGSGHPDAEAWLKDYTTEDPWWFREVKIGGQERVVEIGRNFRYKWAYDPRRAIANHQPCRTAKHLCPVCSLMGMAAEEGQDGQVNAYAGRLRFGHGLWHDERPPLLERVEHLKVMGSPHIGNRGFYLQPSDQQDHLDLEQEEFLELRDGKISPTPARGRKFYWHHTTQWDGQEKSYIQVKKRGGDWPQTKEQSANAELLMPGGRFQFTIHFDNLEKWEIGLLLWTLMLPDGEACAHKLGMGKPLGLGTVQIAVTKLAVEQRVKRYRELFPPASKKGEITADGGALGAGDERLQDYFINLHRKIESWFPGQSFTGIPHVRDLLTIMSQEQPQAAREDETPISYPPGPPGRERDQKMLDSEEQHYSWFTGSTRWPGKGTSKGWDWRQRLLTIEEIAQGKRQLLVPEHYEET